MAPLPGQGLLMSGGWDGARSLTDTWLFNTLGSPAWSRVACASTAGWGPMAGDTERLRVVRPVGNLTEELRSAFTCWTQLTLPQAPNTVENAMAYDKARGETVLFGGHVGGNTYPDVTWIYRPVARPRTESFGLPCRGSLGDVSLRGAPPVLGENLELVAKPALPSFLAVIVVGHSNTHWGNVNLPLDLTASGMPGCALRVAPLWLEPARSVRPLEVVWRLSLPNSSALLGALVFAQAFVADTLPPAGIVGSDGLRLTLGGW
jgi:hypothetical protein